MTFKNEKMPEEAKGKLSIDVSTRPNGSTPTLSKWTVNREMNAFLILVRTEGGAYEGTPLTRYYALSWNDQIIPMKAFASDPTRTEKGIEMTWSVEKVRIPKQLVDKKAEVINLIESAFSVLGRSYNGDQYAEVKVEIELADNSDCGDMS